MRSAKIINFYSAQKIIPSDNWRNGWNFIYRNYNSVSTSPYTEYFWTRKNSVAYFGYFFLYIRYVYIPILCTPVSHAIFFNFWESLVRHLGARFAREGTSGGEALVSRFRIEMGPALEHLFRKLKHQERSALIRREGRMKISNCVIAEANERAASGPTFERGHALPNLPSRPVRPVPTEAGGEEGEKKRGTRLTVGNVDAAFPDERAFYTPSLSRSARVRRSDINAPSSERARCSMREDTATVRLRDRRARLTVFFLLSNAFRARNNHGTGGGGGGDADVTNDARGFRVNARISCARLFVYVY